MTTEEIFSLVAEHMVEGLMFHAQLSDYYSFLGLKGYQKCHEYHYFCENLNFRKITNYYIKHYNKLVKERPFKNPNVISADWYNYTRSQVNSTVRKESISYGINKWVEWEKETKKLYQTYYTELMQNNDIAAALELGKYIQDVDEELAYAEHKLLCCQAIDFDICEIISKQDELYHKYKKKLKEITLC